MTDTNLQIRLVRRPTGLPSPEDFEIGEAPLPDPGEGEVLVANHYLSLDPAMRGWMKEGRSYIPPVELGDVMRGGTYGEVLRSNHPTLAPGDRVVGMLGWQSHALSKGDDLYRVPPEVTGPQALGVLGMTGLTAYFGLLDVGRPQEGDTLLVSGAAGATGSVVGQIGKLMGCKVIGVAGTEAKCAWLTEELGFDGAINYRTSPDLTKAVYQATGGKIDVYFDNVGGEMLDSALACLNRGARVVVCGAISQYNSDSATGPANYLSLLVNRARMEGFIVFDYAPRYDEARVELSRWVQEGKIKHREEIVDGLRNAPQAILRLFDGNKQGKLLIRIGS
ncbi:MAG: NADP-dependent oxidoreductase [Planctomycetes bacterium]|nr:NADP-dependent oxidoreductase [Planctomycetota bacterium]